MSHSEETPQGEAVRFWTEFGFKTMVDHETNALIGLVPEDVVALVASGQDQITRQQEELQEIGIPPGIWADVTPSRRLALFRMSLNQSVADLSGHFSESGRVYGPGDPVQLPSGPFHRPEKYQAKTVDDLAVLDLSDDDLHQQIGGGTLLDRYSLIGTGADLERTAAKNLPLLGLVMLTGQATVIYAPPNSGKTLLTLYLLCNAVLDDRLVPARCYYINADDSQQGLAEKVAILDEVGIHTLAPGYFDFTTGKLLQVMSEMIDQDGCKAAVIVVDTLKKFVDLMDKKQSASFGDVVRQFVLKGGTFIALAHTRKNEGANGEIVYGGTSDVVEDFDAACLLVPLSERPTQEEKLVQFQFKKRRGRNVEECYAYDDNPERSYSERLASVRLVDEGERDKLAEAEIQRTDQDLIEAICGGIRAGVVTKMALVRFVAEQTGASRRAVVKVLERYTGDDPTIHHWFFAIRERGAKVYSVHPPQEPDA
jgi:hypothetical protein